MVRKEPCQADQQVFPLPSHADGSAGISIKPRQRRQHILRRRGQGNAPRASLGVWQFQISPRDIGPAQGLYLAKAAASQDQQAEGRDDKCSFQPRRFHLGQRFAQAPQFCRAQIAFAFFFADFRHMAAGVRPVGAQVPPRQRNGPGPVAARPILPIQPTT